MVKSMNKNNAPSDAIEKNTLNANKSAICIFLGTIKYSNMNIANSAPNSKEIKDKFPSNYTVFSFCTSSQIASMELKFSGNRSLTLILKS